MLRKVILVLLVLMFVPIVVAAPPENEELTWTETDTGITMSGSGVSASTDGEQIGVTYSDASGTHKFGFINKANGTITEKGTVETGHGRSHPMFLEFVSGSTWLEVYYENGGFYSGTTTDGGSSWNSDVLIVNTTHQDRTENVGIIGPTRFQLFVDGTTLRESNNTGSSWNDTGQNCGTSGDSFVPEHHAIIGAYVASEIARGKLGGSGVTLREKDCAIPETRKSLFVDVANGWEQAWLVGEDWMVFTAPTGSAFEVMYVEGATDTVNKLFNTDDDDGNWQLLGNACDAVGAVYVCLMRDGGGFTQVDAWFSLDAGASWEKSTVVENSPMSTNSEENWAVTTDGELFYVIAGSLSNPIYTYISTALPVVTVIPEPSEFDAGLKVFTTDLGFRSPESQMFFALILVGTFTVIGGLAMRIMTPGKRKTTVIGALGVLAGVFCVLLTYLELWMFTLAIVLYGVVLSGANEFFNTYHEIVSREATRIARTTPSSEDDARVPEGGAIAGSFPVGGGGRGFARGVPRQPRQPKQPKLPPPKQPAPAQVARQTRSATAASARRSGIGALPKSGTRFTTTGVRGGTPVKVQKSIPDGARSGGKAISTEVVSKVPAGAVKTQATTRSVKASPTPKAGGDVRGPSKVGEAARRTGSAAKRLFRRGGR